MEKDGEDENTDTFKAELDRRCGYYEKGGKMKSDEETEKQVKELLLIKK